MTTKPETSPKENEATERSSSFPQSEHPAYQKLYPAPPPDGSPAFFPERVTRADSAHLDGLESQSIFIMREAYHYFKKICMPWSMGKDSNVLIWLAKKAFAGHIP